MLAHRLSYRSNTFVLSTLALLAAIVLASCTVGPKYQRPPVPAPPEFKETGNWKPAQPSDAMLKGNWWELFDDPQLNSLEAQVNVSNQSLKAAQQQFLQARSLIKFNRADYFPTVSVNPSATRTRESAHRPLLITTDGQTFNDFILPVDVSYEPDLWGRVRRTVEESRENAQASFGDVENVSLSLHAELAMDYLQLRGLDAEEQLLTSTVDAFKEALQLTLNRFHGGVASEVDVAQAETQLKTTQAQAIDVAVARAQFEHAIAVLIGKPPATFALAPNPLTTPPPTIPPGLPSQLLERRPDIAASERRMAAANAQIGVAKTAYYPLVSLAASGGFETAALGTLLNGPSGLWSIGGAAAQTIFEGGRRRAVSDQAREAYDQNVANYRQTVLTAFQEVEDNLAAQRILSDESRTQDEAVAAAQHSLDLSTTRYKGGVTTYLEVLTAQSVALSDERTDVQILERRMAASVLLIKALGGGWNVSRMPTLASIDHASATAGK